MGCYSDDITFLNEIEVINPDPMISVDLSKENKIIYYVSGDIELSKAKEIITTLIVEPKSVKSEEREDASRALPSV